MAESTETKTLTTARRNAKLTLAQAAKKANLGQTLLRMLEEGSVTPHPHELVALAAVYKVAPEELQK